MTGPQAAGAGFRVEPESALQAVTELQAAKEELVDIRRQATLLGSVHSPTGDQVSFEAARLLERSAVGGKGSLIAALDEGIQQITSTISALEASLRGYETGDAQTAAALR